MWRKRNVRCAFDAVLGLAERGAERVGAHDPDRGDGGGDRHRPVVAVGHVDVGRRRVAAELDVLGQPGQAPDAPAAPQAAGGLEVQLGADQRVEEPERVAVIDHLVFVGDDPEHLAGVLAQVGLEPRRRNQLRRMLGAEVVGPLRRLDDEHVAVGDLPSEAGLVERLVDRAAGTRRARRRGRARASRGR